LHADDSKPELSTAVIAPKRFRVFFDSRFTIYDSRKPGSTAILITENVR
jgi:hypothetical protein